jgi:hypothetical protein
MKLRAISIFPDNFGERTGTWKIALYEALPCSLVPGQTYMWGAQQVLAASQWHITCVEPPRDIQEEAKYQAKLYGVRYIPDISLGGHEGLSDLEVLGEMSRCQV